MAWLIIKPGIERVQALADISRSALCCCSNETRAPIANPPNNAKLECTPDHSTIPLTYIWVHAVVWERSEGQTDRHTDGHDQYTFCLGYASRASREMWLNSYGTVKCVNREVRGPCFELVLEAVKMCQTLLIMDMVHKYFVHSLTVVFVFELSWKLLLIVALFCIGSRPSDHYFRSVCWFVCLFVCLFVQSFSQPSLIRFWSNLDICYMSGSSCVPQNMGCVTPGAG